MALNWECTDIRLSKSRHTQGCKTVNALINNVSLAICCTLPRKRISTMLTEITRLARPVVSTFVIAITAQIEIGRQFRCGRSVCAGKSLNIRFLVEICQG
ncbi:hypothetical protein EBZ39_17000, partial [bacterium]|nr:hypothetical protein [bacterium]